jgi:hypothetical protein
MWRRLKRLFPTWTLLPSCFYTPGAYTAVGIDVVGGLRANPSTARAFDVLEGATDAEFDTVAALAALNARRQDQMLRAVVIAYLTIPVSILAIIAEVAGDTLMSLIRDHTEACVQFGIATAAVPLIYFMSHWRSRQLVSVLDLIRIERGQAPYTAIELRDD